MQQTIKTCRDVSMLILLSAALLFSACNSGTSNKSTVDSSVSKSDTVPAKISPKETPPVTTDSLPPVDTTARSRPETRKT